MAITNLDKPTPSLANSTKISIGETWGSITTSWASETRTWLAISQLITNEAKVEMSIAYLLKEDSFYLLLEDDSKIYINVGQQIINQPKP